jgi:hypothetical protein
MTRVTTLQEVVTQGMQEEMKGRVQLVSEPNLGPVFTTINEDVMVMNYKTMRQTRALRNEIFDYRRWSNENEDIRR